MKAKPFSKVIVIAGPSGVGKSTVIRRMMEICPNTFAFCVSHASREPRAGEIDGISYHFITKEKFEELVSHDAFVEHACVHGNFYGTSKMALEKVASEGKISILDIDIQGCQQIKRQSDFINPIFVRMKISLEELKRRLVGRGTETEESMRIRLSNAEKELSPMDDFFHLEVENITVDDTAEAILRCLKEKGILKE
ncbi:putative guanylate kinase [Monocercomonoides exilis]|uniref:putative guanylate kinase n=1 Tax=Monocercomonoides exilis TaxID=2049356 RepID=UPI00355A53B3|nr:putative guanylate kinase [Monocercomonoides exilis]|eukprot:MONOS_1159.1-p1 / transcript=MONOS_1159.1 / gene=MONOS_1159 / organism=Monocercomonoides_exilis_PA203 / gene_product=guanylate kinase / transcript_product=guanylate kinase / location=Mono_scaffold00019:223468-224205(+) / protein_length=195 / sequence_SO=supercontig / SO=protein_coding / is_pseudo=false